MKKYALISLALLSGCSVMQYQPPAGGDTATVTFTSNNLAAQPMVCVPGAGFRATDTALSQKPFDSKAFDEVIKTMNKAGEVTTTVAASPNTRVGVVLNKRQGNMGRDRCKVAAQFSTEAGGNYRVNFTRNNDQCGLEVRGEDGSRADAVPVDWDCH
ncbi:hypothetical protein [Alloalcanivorax mobilis]|uniref:hypothetical protein n=1 Tax=Alloalcanivorax mobilis TaxID=2019569 RepID=UPI000B5B40F6|nr:hypothetical protein [Alloalcanivorax mobilis]ASK33133.1 hypothetical protein CEK62_01400 [Alcanivorax sp. N3-2A]ASK36951.1 hypothetical protein CEK62_21595 [Alcanivorax sp. N3-2A]|tara:strand:+ start:4207 stop:4677 length:471 start_codon:yes stop_codon:yes gene_type:complete